MFDLTKLSFIPNKTGVYLFYNSKKKVIYVGKAKSLKNRVRSYFSKKNNTIKNDKLALDIYFFDYLLTNSEKDALFLEDNLIKKHQPKYNFLLKDDKTYPWICLKKEPYPSVFISRNRINNENVFFGPFINSKQANKMVDLINFLFPSLLDFYIKDNFRSKNDVEKSDIIFNKIKKILSGNFSFLLKEYNKEIKKYSKRLDFEKALNIKSKIDLIEDYINASSVVFNKNYNSDVFCIISENKNCFVSFLRIKGGRILFYKNSIIKNNLIKNESAVLKYFIEKIYEEKKPINKKIALNINILNDKYNFFVPKKGVYKKFIDFSLLNLKNYKTKFTFNNKPSLDLLKKILFLNKKPKHIECFDNSNLFGKNPTSACVVFHDGKAEKKEYRHYGIKTVNSINDFDSMYEVVKRRYKYLIDNNKKLPDLILIDGGKGQLTSAYNALCNLKIEDKIDLIAIAKRFEHIYSLNENSPFVLNKYSNELKLLQFIRNEAHRFCLRLHRNKRSKDFFK